MKTQSPSPYIPGGRNTAVSKDPDPEATKTKPVKPSKLSSDTVADLRGRREPRPYNPPAPPPPTHTSQNFPNFMQGKFGKIICWRPSTENPRSTPDTLLTLLAVVGKQL